MAYLARGRPVRTATGLFMRGCRHAAARPDALTQATSHPLPPTSCHLLCQSPHAGHAVNVGCSGPRRVLLSATLPETGFPSSSSSTKAGFAMQMHMPSITTLFVKSGGLFLMYATISSLVDSSFNSVTFCRESLIVHFPPMP